MRHIERLSEPEILVKKKVEWTNNFIASGKARPDSSKYAHNEIKTTLFTMSHNKCFYCEGLLKGTTSEIDHFIEVAENKQLAFEWNNLMLACDNCNNKIANQSIPVTDVLNPCFDSDDEIDKHLSFENEQITFNTEKGEKTIIKFRLSSERLDYLRMKQLQKFSEELHAIKNKMITEGRKSLTVKELELLKRFSKHDYCYSKMFAQYLKRQGIH